MKPAKHRSLLSSPSSVDDLLRPELGGYSTSSLIAELTRRGVFQRVRELPMPRNDEARRTFVDETMGARSA